ncbi:MAG: ribonuclease VapC [Candidatus Verstraetearchaeota archaeon]|nr:ribonuclease VapC [Candidatus Verstraetearchaeota archaeon]
MKRVLVLDSSAIMNGYNPLLVTNFRQIISVDALNEILKDDEKALVEYAIEINRLEKATPKPATIMKVEEVARKTNDRKYLSNSDLSILALALDLIEDGCNPVILTDDFSIQNVAKVLGIEYAPIATQGIRKVINWKLYCPACGRRYEDENISECKVCGTKLKRKPRL